MILLAPAGIPPGFLAATSFGTHTREFGSLAGSLVAAVTG